MPSLIGGHRKAPCSSRFQNSTRPDPSQARIFRRFARFDRNMKHPRERIVPQLLAHQGGEAVGASAEVHRLGGHQHPHASRNGNHVAAFTVRSTVCSVVASVPGGIRMVALPITISIIGNPLS